MTRSLEALCEAAEIQSGTNPAEEGGDGPTADTDTSTGTTPLAAAAAANTDESNTDSNATGTVVDTAAAASTSVAVNGEDGVGTAEEVNNSIIDQQAQELPHEGEPHQQTQSEQQQHQQQQQQELVNITTTANPVVQVDPVDPPGIAATTANPIASPEAGTATPNPVIPVDHHQQAAQVQLQQHTTVEQMQMSTETTVSVSVPTLPPIAHHVPPANPMETSNNPLVQAQVHTNPDPVAASTPTLDFHMDVDETNVPVPALPALNAGPATITDSGAGTGTVANISANLPTTSTTAATTTTTTGTHESLVHSQHTVVVDDAAAAEERAQQEAIAAAVVAAHESTVRASAVAPSSSSKQTRKRGWVKKTWEERLEELKAYKDLNGHCNVPTICKSNPSLGHWVHDQRKQYRLYQNNKQTSMNPLRIAQLEEVGFKWALQRHSTMKTWAERFAQLLEFKKANGHCNVPIRYKVNPSLGQWVSTQRQEYSNFRNGKKSNMSDERISKLEEAEFCWSLRDTAKMAPRKSWDMHFAALKEFKEQNGHCDVRVRSKQNPTGSLGRWVEKQRGQYHSRNEGRESKLTKQQIDKLDSIGFKWRIRHERNKISGCARNPELKLGDEELMDDYTKRKIDDEAKELELAQEQAARAQALTQREAQETQAAEMAHQSLTKMEVDEPQQMNVDHIHQQTNIAIGHMDTQPQILPDQMGAQMESEVAQQMGAQMQMQAEPMKIENHIEGAVVAAAAIEPMSIEAAAAAAAEAIPADPPVQMVHEAVPAPVPVPLPIHEHEHLDEPISHEV